VNGNIVQEFNEKKKPAKQFARGVYRYTGFYQYQK
jgi:hypothetical protein